LSDPNLNGGGKLPPSHVTALPFGTSDVIRVYGAGGSGLGDPLFREPSRVVDDLENAIITADVIPTIYGVVLDAEGRVDDEATKRRRHEIRTERLGSEPSREPAPMTEYRPPLRVDDGHLSCNHCGERLAAIADSWKEHASARSWPLAERAKDLGAMVRPTTAISLVMWEFSCPACGSLLEVDVAEEGDPVPNDIRLGVSSDEPGEPF
jgi:N-methylhydantoinase B